MKVELSDNESPSPGSHVFPYASAAAFRTALRDRFAVIAKAESRYSLDELQRQFAYDRALARLFTAPDATSWVLKGAVALLARLEQARHSKDIDVYFAEQSASVSDARGSGVFHDEGDRQPDGDDFAGGVVELAVDEPAPLWPWTRDVELDSGEPGQVAADVAVAELFADDTPHVRGRR